MYLHEYLTGMSTYTSVCYSSLCFVRCLLDVLLDVLSLYVSVCFLLLFALVFPSLFFDNQSHQK